MTSSCPIKTILLLSIGAATMLPLSSTNAAESALVSVKVSNPDIPAPPDFEYILENRADPFLPFITEKAAASDVDMNEIVDPEGPLSGMQLFEPGQLTLVALMDTGERAVAMVEDFMGKGYVLTEGMKIGKRGIVSHIASNSVLIEETARTRAGKEIVTKTLMTLKKKEEKKE